MHETSVESIEFIICPGKNIFKFSAQFDKTSSFIMGTMYFKIDKLGFLLCSQVDRGVIQGRSLSLVVDGFSKFIL